MVHRPELPPDVLETLIATIPAGVIVADARGDFILVNDEAKSLLGEITGTAAGPAGAYTLHRPNGSPFRSEDLPLVRALAGETVRSVEILARRTDGVERMLLASGAPLRDPAGTIAGAIAVLQDVTARTPDEAALRDSELRLRQMIDANPIGVLSSDAGGRIVDANDAYLRIVGRTRDDLRAGRVRWDVITVPEHRGRTERAIAEARERGVSTTYEKEYLRDDGLRVPVLIAWAALGSHGELTAFVLDLSDRKRAEQALREADRRKDEFIAVLSHELRNPLAPIRFAVRLLERAGRQDPTIQQALEVITRQVAQLTHLIDDLLDVSRITSNKVQLRMQRIELSALMRSVVEAAESRIAQAGHRFTTSWEGGGAIDADPARIVQVLTNLLNNAAKYTPRGGDIMLSVTAEGGEAVIRVRDNGVGIPADALPRIFEMFHQEERSLERSAGGLGIGLALAKRLVDMHGGTIDASSRGRNQGAEFTVRLPLVDGSAIAASPERLGERHDTPTSRLAVLIVDDNVDSAEMLDLLVAAYGHTTRVVHDGESALAVADEFLPDVVLLDIGLPGINGYEVARRLRQRERPVHLVAITGWGQPEDRRQAREAGFDCHMTKPAGADMVLAYLNAVAHRRECRGCSSCLRTPLTRASDRIVAL